MKIFATSDMHGNLSDLNPEGCDIVVIAGDFAKLSSIGKWQWYDQKKWIQKKFVTWIEKYPDMQFVIVPGNHDMCMDQNRISGFRDINWDIRWPSNAHVLIDDMVVINGLKIYGTPRIPVISYRWAFETESCDLKTAFSRIPYGLDILVTHTPPHIPNATLDRSLQNGGGFAFGSPELTNEIFEKNPKYVFCGHIHSGDHECCRFGNTMIYNVSRVDEHYEIAYEPTVVEIDA